MTGHSQAEPMIIEQKSINIKFLYTGRKPPVVTLSSFALKEGHADFYIDTGADVSIIKEKCTGKGIPIDDKCI